MIDFEDRYYSMLEICKYLGISRDSALKWIANKGASTQGRQEVEVQAFRN